MKAILLANDSLFVAVQPDEKHETNGEIRVYSASDGKKLGKINLPAAPRFDSMAAIKGRLFVATRDNLEAAKGEEI